MHRTDTSARRRLLLLAAELLAGAGAEDSAPMTVLLIRGPVRVKHTATAAELAQLEGAGELGEMASNIVQALQEAGRELNSKELARRAGYVYGPRFRGVLRELQVKGLVRRGTEGYRLAEPSEEKRL